MKLEGLEVEKQCRMAKARRTANTNYLSKDQTRRHYTIYLHMAKVISPRWGKALFFKAWVFVTKKQMPYGTKSSHF